jgi:hypothetical protein
MQTEPPRGLRDSSWAYVNKLEYTKEGSIEWLGRTIVDYTFKINQVIEQVSYQEMFKLAIQVSEAGKVVQTFEPNEYSTNMLSHPKYKEACDFVEKHKDDPKYDHYVVRAFVEGKLYASKQPEQAKQPYTTNSYTDKFASPNVFWMEYQ